MAGDELEQLIRQNVGPRLSQAQMLLKENHNVKAQQEFKEQLAKLQGDLKESQAENLRLASRIELLESEKSGLLSHLTAIQKVSSLEMLNASAKSGIP